MKNQANLFSCASFNSTAILALGCLLLLALWCASPMQAQVTTASLRGTVMDDQGAVVADATVTITNIGTAYSRTMHSGSDGSYSYQELPLGMYRIHAEHAGFKGVTQTGIELHVADNLVINVTLHVGAVSELVTLMPGVSQGEGYSVNNKGLKGGSNLAVSGSSSNGNQWLVDGANNNDTGSQRTILIYPSTESIEEFKIERSSYGAEFGGMSGATINLVTKSGKNDFHGSVYYSGRNDKLNAYDPILKDGCPTPLSSATCPKNKFRGNDYGYTIGGPVKKGKIFFFWSQEWNKRIEGIARSGHVPTLGERVGDFSAIAACPGNTGGNNNAGFPVAGLTDPNPADGSAFGKAPNNAGTLVPAILPSN